MWYALKIDSEIWFVRWFRDAPTVFDFGAVISSHRVYDVVPVDIVER
jgi:hypothetical protein